MAESSPARRVEWPRRSPAAATRAKAGSEPRHQAGAPLNTASRRAFASDIPHVSFSKSECVAALVYTYHHHVRERRTLHRRNHSANTIVKTALTGRLRLPSSDSACSSRSMIERRCAPHAATTHAIRLRSTAVEDVRFPGQQRAFWAGSRSHALASNAAISFIGNGLLTR